MKTRLKSLYRSRGISSAGDAVYRPEKREEYVRRLPQAVQTTTAMLGRELDALVTLQEEAEQGLVCESHRHPISRILETAPGFGAKRTAQLIPIVTRSLSAAPPVAFSYQEAVLVLLRIRDHDAHDLGLGTRKGWLAAQSRGAEPASRVRFARRTGSWPVMERVLS